MLQGQDSSVSCGSRETRWLGPWVELRFCPVDPNGWILRMKPHIFGFRFLKRHIHSCFLCWYLLLISFGAAPKSQMTQIWGPVRGSPSFSISFSGSLGNVFGAVCCRRSRVYGCCRAWETWRKRFWGCVFFNVIKHGIRKSGNSTGFMGSPIEANVGFSNQPCFITLQGVLPDGWRSNPIIF